MHCLLPLGCGAVGLAKPLQDLAVTTQPARRAERVRQTYTVNRLSQDFGLPGVPWWHRQHYWMTPFVWGDTRQQRSPPSLSAEGKASLIPDFAWGPSHAETLVTEQRAEVTQNHHDSCRAATIGFAGCVGDWAWSARGVLIVGQCRIRVSGRIVKMRCTWNWTAGILGDAVTRPHMGTTEDEDCD